MIGVYLRKKAVLRSLNSSENLSLNLLNSSLIPMSDITIFCQESMFCFCASFGKDRHTLFPTVLDFLEWFCTKAFNVSSNSSLEILFSSEDCAKLKTSSIPLLFLLRFNVCKVPFISNSRSLLLLIIRHSYLLKVSILNF